MQYPYRSSEYVEGSEYYPPARYPAAGGYYYDRERLGDDYVVEPGVYSGLRPGAAAYESISDARRPYYVPRRSDYVYGRDDAFYGAPGYGARPPVQYVRPGAPLIPPVVYDDGQLLEPAAAVQSSDLGLGARDSRIVKSTDYRAGYGRPDFTSPYVATGAVADGAAEAEIERLENRLERERRHKHEAEAVAAAASAYGLYERHERHNLADEYNGSGYYSDGYDEGYRSRNSSHHRRHHRLRNLFGID